MDWKSITRPLALSPLDELSRPMPELPEVETVKTQLSQILIHQPVIEKFQFNRKDLRDPMPVNELKKMTGAKILEVQRRAKYLLFRTTKGGILSHLGMSGSWRVPDGNDVRVHDHILVHLSNGASLVYHDPRRFGIFETIDLEKLDENKRLRDLGPEPLSETFHADPFYAKIKTRKTAIKTAIMDQKVVVGVGNIYASEALFLAKIHPQKKANRLNIKQASDLVSAIKKVLSRAIEAGGSSISDFRHTDFSMGYFQNQFSVYDRGGLECVVCATKIKTAVVGGRSTFWCQSCQKK